MNRFVPRSSNHVRTSAVDPAAIIRRARRLRFRVRPTAVTQLAGAYLSARPGTGLTFAELRAYEPGDDVRHLDWNVTARQGGRPFVRRYVEERSLSIWIVVDVSASLRFGVDGRSKADRAAQGAALLAAAAIQNGDRAGLTLVSDRVEAELPPGGGPKHLARLLRILIATPAASRQSDISIAISRPRRFARRGLLVAFSDFLTPEPIGPWRQVRRRGEVVAIRVVDPREVELPNVGLMSIEDAETRSRRVVDTGSRRIREDYARAAASRDRDFRSWCQASDVVGLDLSTEEDPLDLLTSYFRGSVQNRLRV